MKTSTFKMIAAFAAVGLLFANVALAKNGGGNGGNGGNHSNGGFKLSIGGGNNSQKFNSNSNHCKDGYCKPYKYNCNSGYCSTGYYYSQPYVQVYGSQPILSQAFEPFHNSYVVLPGDSFFTVSLKEYGTSANAQQIAQFNGLPQSAALVPGQVLMLPSIGANGSLTQSGSPAPESLPGMPINNISMPSNNFSMPSSNFSMPSNNSSMPSSNFSMPSNNSSMPSSNLSSVAAPAVEAPRSKVTVGSTLLVDGQTFGDKQGAARLRISGLSLPIEVLEWTVSSVKIHLPMVELTSATNADIEVVRADGSLASKTAVELSAATQVALTK